MKRRNTPIRKGSKTHLENCEIMKNAFDNMGESFSSFDFLAECRKLGMVESFIRGGSPRRFLRSSSSTRINKKLWNKKSSTPGDQHKDYISEVFGYIDPLAKTTQQVFIEPTPKKPSRLREIYKAIGLLAMNGIQVDIPDDFDFEKLI